MYADNLINYASINNNNDWIELQNELDLFCQWCSKWGLTINIKRCILMHLGHSKNCFLHKLNDTNLEISECEHILDVHIDNKLTFADHVY